MQPLFSAAFFAKTHHFDNFPPLKTTQLLHLSDLQRLKLVFNYNFR